MIELIRSVKEDIYKKLPVFALPEYLKSRSCDYGYFTDGKLILPFYSTSKLGFKRIFFTTECVILDKNHEDYVTKAGGILYPHPDKELLFLNGIKSVASKAGYDMIDLPFSSAIFGTFASGSIEAEYGTYVVDITGSEDEIMNGIQSRFRSSLRKAINEGLIVRTGMDQRDIAVSLVKETYIRQGKTINLDHEIDDHCRNIPDNIKFYVVYNGETPEGSAIIFYTKNGRAYYAHGGSIAEPHQGAVKLLHYQAMLDLKTEGVTVYDFMGARINPEPGSKYEGLQIFKSRMGSTLLTGYRWIQYIKPIKCAIFLSLFKIKSILKKSDPDTGIFYERKRQGRK